MDENRNKLEQIMLENKLTYEKVGKNWANVAGAKHLLLKTLKELSEIAESKSLNVVIIDKITILESEKDRKIRAKLNTLNSNFRAYYISFFVEQKEFCKEKKIMIEITKNRINTLNLYSLYSIKAIENLSNYACKEMFDSFLVFNFASSETRDFWRNK